ncbi:MAG: hypothetical protein A3I66_00190 [Burkholderiales bacterium RIFCSPLOWO2_02_FULL_57_36]|nr:MAG: hypothetical protein A3I66_00190 [Burkholderiales bacterium RIFCSPLOWO2_02_FULL_57_36]
MKGVVFDEFVEMVEERFSAEMADKIINASHLSTGGAYTSVGTYDHRELIELVRRLSDETGIAVPDLLRIFGEYLFKRFYVLYPSFVTEHDSSFALLSSLDNKIHVEVKKLYPDAELPRFTHEMRGPENMILTYRSKRPFGDLAEGLIRGCIHHYGESITLEREDLPVLEGAHIRFTLTRHPDGRGY